MKADVSHAACDVLSFGPFELRLRERLLIRGDQPVSVSERGLDILIALATHPSEVLTKRDLMAKAWPDVNVDEGSLRFHMAGLRKALGDGEEGARYITTQIGRGYCFVVPIQPSGASPEAVAVEASSIDAGGKPGILPPRLQRMLGRDEETLTVAARLREKQFVTLIGPGGVGKTTVAVAVGHHFGGLVKFVDFGALRDPGLVPTVVASALGITVQTEDPTPSLLIFLKHNPLLLVLDNCEHVIELASLLAENIYQSAPKTHLLVTSREALRVEGEHVHRLAPLGCPSAALALPLAELLQYPAPRLFVDRASAGGHDLQLTDADGPVIAAICEKLDGIALAIELAAGRVATYGLQQTAKLLQKRLSLAWVGRRTALPRQQTMQATLDWSYDLLSPLEKRVMNCLAIFVGHFSLAAARAVLLESESDPEHALSAIDSLIAKSLLTIDRSREHSFFRLLEVTRAYGFEKLTVSGEADMVAARHAAYYADLGLSEVPSRLAEVGTAASAREHLDNARAALEWSFGPTGDLKIGVRLAASSAPMLERLSLLSECRRWCQRAVESLDDVPSSQSTELELQAALGLSLMFTRGNSDATGVALRRALTIAEQRDDCWNQLRLLGRLHIFDERIGDFDQSLAWAERANRVAMGLGEPEALGVSNSLLGVAYHLMGDQPAARSALEKAMMHRLPARRSSSVYYGFDHGNRAGITLARTLWLQGSYARSRELSDRIVEEAALLDQPTTLCMALIGTITIDLIAGALDRAEISLSHFIAQAEAHALGPYLAVGEGLKGELALKRGDVAGGVPAVAACLVRLRAARYEVLTTEFNSALAEGLARLGRAEEALQLINETIADSEKGGELYAMPELLRIQAGLAGAAGHEDEHEAMLLRSIDWSRRQGAPTWELRAANDLARLWIGRGRPEAAPELLHRVLRQFTDGVETEDLRQSRTILAGLGSRLTTLASQRA